MKRLFLTSSIKHVAKDIASRIGNVKGMKLVFIDTPIEFKRKEKSWLNEDRLSLVDVGFDVTDYTITGKKKYQIEKELSVFDVIYISGGNQLYFLQKIQETECSEVLRDLIEKEGKIFIGTSAGSMIMAQDISCSYRPDIEEELTNYGGVKLKDYHGLGMVDFIVFPHWGDEGHKDKYFEYRLEHAYTTNDKIILLTNYQYVRVEGEMYRIEEVEK